jgi:hypothetical protein
MFSYDLKMTYNNRSKKMILVIVLLLLVLTGFGILWLLFAGNGLFGISIVETSDYDGSGKGRMLDKINGGWSIRIDGDSITFPDGFYSDYYEIIEEYDETERQGGGRRSGNGEDEGEECVVDSDCGSDEFEDICYLDNVYEESTKNFCDNGYCEVDVDKEEVEVCEFGCDDGECDEDENLPNDLDGDGYDDAEIGEDGDDGLPLDCNDNNFDVNPGVAEMCGDGIDNNCNGEVDEECGLFCTEDLECGVDGFVGDSFCWNDDVYQAYESHTCELDGSCDSEIGDVLVDSCDYLSECSVGECVPIVCEIDNECDDDEDLTIDSCVNPGELGSFCENTPISCNVHSDCGMDGVVGDDFCAEGDVKQEFVTYTCENPGTVSSVCTSDSEPVLVDECESGEACYDASCVEVSCGVNADCGFDDFIGETYCQEDNVYQNYRSYMCTDGATPNSLCSSDVEPTLVDSCESGCFEGSCIVEICDNGIDDDGDGLIDGLTFSEGNDDIPQEKIFINELWMLGSSAIINEIIEDIVEYSGGTQILGKNVHPMHTDDTLTRACNLWGYGLYKDTVSRSLSSPHNDVRIFYNAISDAWGFGAGNSGLLADGMTCYEPLPVCNNNLDDDGDGFVDSDDLGCAASNDDSEVGHDPECVA